MVARRSPRPPPPSGRAARPAPRVASTRRPSARGRARRGRRRERRRRRSGDADPIIVADDREHVVRGGSDGGVRTRLLSDLRVVVERARIVGDRAVLPAVDVRGRDEHLTAGEPLLRAREARRIGELELAGARRRARRERRSTSRHPAASFERRCSSTGRRPTSRRHGASGARRLGRPSFRCRSRRPSGCCRSPAASRFE